MQDQPLVSVLTPVYNGEKYLAECIESVLKQTYTNWEYIILNNCSTDGTQQIAERYAALDNRVRIHRNEQLLDIISNHNKAFRLISPDAKYCKVVSADDWLFPECLDRMVALAEANPSAGIVGCYQLSGGGKNWRDWQVRWAELPYPSPLVSGREACRTWFFGGPYVFGTPTSVLYRADLVRMEVSFYPNSSAEADTSACIGALRKSDFGFVHQVLCYERIHEAQISTTSKRLGAYRLARLADLRTYGQFFLTQSEFRECLKSLSDDYYSELAVATVNFRGKDFWEFHKRRLNEIGLALDRGRLTRAAISKFIELVLNPKQSISKFWRRRYGKVARSNALQSNSKSTD